ncbi:hypothetical protein [Candidatus Nitrosopumilus sediminis]|uniref:Uncharacterized protein n=1 Tax=Candidatus Nitrosopumilus sediminis TaxID=1229909 RepID=K0BFH6_9ARCH|nr:hypothetical protein [Candidatus Nitrosopumilus sediminis]AFS83780.1 hypothetical protein NSED_09970 [Candidatus Nitrosopumilus sediminis]
MEQKIAIMSVILGIAILGGSFSVANSLIADSNSNGIRVSDASTGLLGHVALTIYDSEGNVKRYMQGDNVITNNGENCIAELVFGVTTGGASQCQTSTNGIFRVVSIGLSPVAPDGSSLELGTTFARTSVTPTVVSSTGSSADTSKAVVTLLATFTADASRVFTEAGLMDTENILAGSDNMMAHKAFDTAATLTNGDTVAVTWTIDIGP